MIPRAPRRFVNEAPPRISRIIPYSFALSSVRVLTSISSLFALRHRIYKNRFTHLLVTEQYVKYFAVIHHISSLLFDLAGLLPDMVMYISQHIMSVSVFEYQNGLFDERVIFVF